MERLLMAEEKNKKRILLWIDSWNLKWLIRLFQEQMLHSILTDSNLWLR